MTSLYSHIILVLFWWTIKQDYQKKNILSLETGASLHFILIYRRIGSMFRTPDKLMSYYYCWKWITRLVISFSERWLKSYLRMIFTEDWLTLPVIIWKLWTYLEPRLWHHSVNCVTGLWWRSLCRDYSCVISVFNIDLLLLGDAGS